MKGLGIASVTFIDYPERLAAAAPIDKQVMILLPDSVERCDGVSNRFFIDVLRCLLQQWKCIPPERIGEKTASPITNYSSLVLQGSEAEVESIIAGTRIANGVVDKGCTPLPSPEGTVGL